ncbi:MAG: TIGR04222 domain-containing membrane protein [Alphaproteobacteria bacterium]|nr:TIGR04222 domain-containing membrane protein [Alphaproteobacteria bacterium]
MNVFDLPGPEFLDFYIPFVAIVAGLALAVLSLTARDRRLGPSLLADPYQIAYLRGGVGEMIRLALVALADRGQVELPRVGTVAPSDRPMPRSVHPIERAIFAHCPRPTGHINALLRMNAVRDACTKATAPLIEMGLVPTPAENGRRTAVTIGAWLLIMVVGLAKLELAVERGRPNIGFLILTMIAATIFFLILALLRNRTAEGRRMLNELRSLLAARRDAPRPGSDMSEALLLAAVYGSAGLTGFTDTRALYKRAGWNSSNNSCSSGGGSSCGAGSGCGGGGGCGGCGSS